MPLLISYNVNNKWQSSALLEPKTKPPHESFSYQNLWYTCYNQKDKKTYFLVGRISIVGNTHYRTKTLTTPLCSLGETKLLFLHIKLRKFNNSSSNNNNNNSSNHFVQYFIFQRQRNIIVRVKYALWLNAIATRAILFFQFLSHLLGQACQTQTTARAANWVLKLEKLTAGCSTELHDTLSQFYMNLSRFDLKMGNSLVMFMNYLQF